ncbi:hypothetical protein BH23THE1_BH23THE1_32110 [soil metagenome]
MYIEDLLSRASLLAQESRMTQRHGAILVVGSKIVGSGHNCERNSFHHSIESSSSCHAEMAAIWAGRHVLKNQRVLRG